MKEIITDYMNYPTKPEVLRKINPLHQVQFDKKFSDHLTYDEATVSMFDICNRPGVPQKKAMTRLANLIYEPLLEQFENVFGILSFYECQAVSSKMRKRVPNQHMAGEEMDFYVREESKVSGSKIFEWMYFNLKYDRLVWGCMIPEDSHCCNLEPPFIHVSLKFVNNRQATYRDYFDENGLLKTKRIYR